MQNVASGVVGAFPVKCRVQGGPLVVSEAIDIRCSIERVGEDTVAFVLLIVGMGLVRIEPVPVKELLLEAIAAGVLRRPQGCRHDGLFYPGKYPKVQSPPVRAVGCGVAMLELGAEFYVCPVYVGFVPEGGYMGVLEVRPAGEHDAIALLRVQIDEGAHIDLPVRLTQILYALTHCGFLVPQAICMQTHSWIVRPPTSMTWLEQELCQSA